MDDAWKNNEYTSSQEHVTSIQKSLSASLNETRETLKNGKASYRTMNNEERVNYMTLLPVWLKKEVALTTLMPSPYFTRLTVHFDGERSASCIYFAKCEYSEKRIYSWTTPISTLRFEDIGTFSLTLPNGAVRTGQILRKDHFMIHAGKIIFYAAESDIFEKTLVYQEFLSKRNTTFALPEIVAQMEKAQDEAIRAHPRGPLVISGPAGSGKTTLALHRLAYLVQAPDTAPLYPAREILVIVQDQNAVEYFSELLPSLGIHDVTITSFPTWAMATLELENYTHRNTYSGDTRERLQLAIEKSQALQNSPHISSAGAVHTVLSKNYDTFLSPRSKELFLTDKKTKTLDDYDLTLLLLLQQKKKGALGTTREKVHLLKNNKVRRGKKWSAHEHPLIIVDEFQNYLSAQLNLLSSTLSETSSLLLIGQMKQQIKIGTITNFSELTLPLAEDRIINLHKVYRNTKSILRYINECGFTTDIPEAMEEGSPVKEYSASRESERISALQEILDTTKEGTRVSILTLSDDEAHDLAHQIPNSSHYRVLSIAASQGLEFDTVIMIGAFHDFFKENTATENISAAASDISRIQRDLIYVGLTRALTQLHVISDMSLKTVLRNFHEEQL